MNNYSFITRLPNVGKLAKREVLTIFSNYRPYGRACLFNGFPKRRIADKYIKNCNIFDVSGITSCYNYLEFSTSSLYNSNKDNDISLAAAASLLNGKDEAEDKNARNDSLAEEVEKGLSELEELTNLQVRRVPTVFVSDYESELPSDDEGDEPESAAIGEQKTTVKLPRHGDKVFELFGTPDPNQPVSDVPCHGCGAHFHCKDPGLPGYLPSQTFLALPKDKLTQCICQRCQLLKTKQIALDLKVPVNKYNPILREVKKHMALVILLVDMTDLSNAFHKTFRYINSVGRPVFIIGNKIDLIPKDDDGYLNRLMYSLVETARLNGFSEETNVKHFSLVSAKTGYGVEDLITKMLNEWRLKGHVFIMGCANCGKSTLFNTLLASDFCRSSAKEVINRATTSVWPGTTLNLLKFPIVNPKPKNMYERKQRLLREENEITQEYKLNKSRDIYKPHLQSRIGSTFLTSSQMAIRTQSSDNGGYLVPTYNNEDESSGELVESIGLKGAVGYLGVKPLPYDDSKFKFWCFDTPGLVNPDQIINLLNQSELLACIPKKGITARTYLLMPGQVMFVSGLSRIDYCEGKEYIFVSVYTALALPVHIVDSRDADDFYNKNLGTKALGIPIGDSERLKSLPPLVGKDFEITGTGFAESAADVVLSSLGWVTLTFRRDDVVQMRAYTPDGLGCKLRTPPLLIYSMNLKGSKIYGTNKYRTIIEEKIYKKNKEKFQR